MISLFKSLSLLITLLVCFCFTASASAFDPDSLQHKKDSTKVRYFSNNFEKFGILHLSPLDTTIAGFQNFDPLTKRNQFSSTLGNIGHVSLLLLPFSYTPASGYNYGIHSFDNYLYKNDSVRYYKVFKTYTDLEYIQGTKKELFFHAVFSRNLYKSLNIGFDLRVLSSNGFYIRQRTNHINFVFTSQFFSRNKRYGAIANMRFNLLKNQENGGIKSDSLFEENLETNREIVPISLSNAQNRVKENGFFMKHYFNLSRHLPQNKDSLVIPRRSIELGRISYSFEYNRQVFHYLDFNIKDSFYENIYLDSLKTSDSININKFSNTLSWTNPNFRPDRKNRLLQLELSLKHDYTEAYNNNTKSYFNQIIPSGEISFRPYYGFMLHGYADYVIGNYNGGDLSIKASVSQLLGSEKKNAGSVAFRGYYAFQKPGWFYEYYQGNNFSWDTAWSQQGNISGGFDYRFKDIINAGVTISRISNFVYLDNSAKPKQYEQQFGYFQLFMNTKIPAGKFIFHGNFVYHTVQGASMIHIPSFLGSLNVYFTQPLFHGAATFQPGLTFKYNSLYYGNAYMPAIRSFYLQDKKQIGDYVFMDVFINVKIQRARIFFMYSHFNATLMEYRYYTVPHYPMPDAAFRFGVTWRFHD